MRIGLLIYDSLETTTGGYLYDRMLVDHLRAQGDQVEVVSLPWRNYGRHLTDNFSASLLRRLNDGCDVLIQDELNHPSVLWLNRPLKRRTKRPIVALVHLLRSSEARPAWQNRLYAAAERTYFKTIDGVIFNCGVTREAVERLLGRQIPGIVARPGWNHLPSTPGLTDEEIVHRARQPGPLRILCVANLLPVKGVDVLIRALAQLASDEWRLQVAGSLEMDPAWAARIRRQIGEAGLVGQVKLLGSQPPERIPELLSGSQLLAVPSYYEAFGIAYLEAMSFGLAVIASSAGGAREVVTDGREGFLVAPGDSKGLAGRLKELIRDRERLAQMSLAAHERILRHPTWEESMGTVRDFLVSFAERPK